MSNSIPFSRVQYFASLGVSVVNPDHCCVAVDTLAPVKYTLTPPNDSAYVAHVIFTFCAPRKVPFAAIISNLKESGIEPINGFRPPCNPDNKYYTGLPVGHYNKIIEVLEATLAGICMSKDGDMYTVEYVEEKTKNEVIMREESKIIHIDTPLVVFLHAGKSSPYYVHRFQGRNMSNVEIANSIVY